ncbi:hypothetical protein [Streptomyces iranensis]|uniref:Endogenous inhibitor of DNA gyrase (YacG/DUF329 family) n=1 Tax=Streptomyces iranensis TaxID=576784 RepID=A0A060ZG14_9ACTN|nr:hypothetical protein [Streptomyces iranensis]MBP2066052.1 endogenous inhibitor of DNA gyrase (YacG/DUF329 family) [Streptomyces iranensis]CDR04913.1 predicted protein [Streptomyces iranensis]
MDTAARRCAECGAEFTWTSRNPTRRFCGSRCKTRWWRAHRRGTAIADAADRTYHRSQPAPVPPLSTGHECPNCGQHITVLNLIVAADGGSGSGTLTG